MAYLVADALSVTVLLFLTKTETKESLHYPPLLRYTIAWAAGASLSPSSELLGWRRRRLYAQYLQDIVTKLTTARRATMIVNITTATYTRVIITTAVVASGKWRPILDMVRIRMVIMMVHVDA